MGGKKLKTEDAVGLKFNMLTVVSKHGSDSRNHTLWLCECECGSTTTSEMCDLKSGKKKSCGCLKLTHQQAGSIKHGASSTSADKEVRRAWTIWCGLRARCLSETNEAYKDYGGRGIDVCPRWLDFSNFLEDMGVPGDGYTIERVDVNKGYSKENCTWIKLEEQNRNKRTTIRVELNGTSMCLKQATKILDIPYMRTYKRMRYRGMSFEEAIR